MEYMDNRKKIAFLLPSLSGGGAERMAGLVSKRFDEIYDVYIMLFNIEKMPYEYSGKIIDLDFSKIHKKYKKYGSLIYKVLLPFKYIEIIKKIKKVKELYQIDVCISFLETSNVISLGFLGIYIAKIYEEVKGRPVYLIESILNFEDDA